MDFLPVFVPNDAACLYMAGNNDNGTLEDYLMLRDKFCSETDFAYISGALFCVLHHL